MSEKAYGILWTDKGGVFNFSHAHVVAQIAERVATDYTGDLWLLNHYGQTKLAEARGDNAFAKVEIVTADTSEPSDEVFAALDFPVLRVAMPRGRFKMYYPLSMRDRSPTLRCPTRLYPYCTTWLRTKRPCVARSLPRLSKLSLTSQTLTSSRSSLVL